MKCIQKNAVTQIRIQLRKFKSHEFVDVRKWRKDHRTGEYTPTKQGITIPPDLIDEIILAFLSCTSSSEDEPDESEQ